MSMYTWRDIREVLDFRELDNVREVTSYAIQSQYSASNKILALSAQYQAQIDPNIDVDLFYRYMFNIYTAEGIGLDNWGEILDIGRTIEDGNTKITLEDEYYRLLLLYKAMANISASTADAQNKLLQALVNTGIAGFPRSAYVLEIDTMVIRWVFEDFLDPIQLAVFRAAGTLARGAGVGWEFYAVNPSMVFGFTPGWQPFNQAPFAPDNALIENRGDSIMADPMSGTIMPPEIFDYSGSQAFTLSRPQKFIIEAMILKDDVFVYLQVGDYTAIGSSITVNSTALETGDKVKITYAV